MWLEGDVRGRKRYKTVKGWIMRALCVSQESGCLSACGCMANYRWPNIPGHSSHGRLASVSPFLEFGQLSESFEQGNMAEVMMPVSNPWPQGRRSFYFLF